MPNEKPTAATLAIFDTKLSRAMMLGLHRTLCKIASDNGYDYRDIWWDVDVDTRDNFFEDTAYESVIIIRWEDEPLENPIEELQWIPQILPPRWIRHAIIDYSTPDDVLEGVVLRSIRAPAPWNVMPNGSTIELVEVSDRDGVINTFVRSTDLLSDDPLPDAPIGRLIRAWNGATWSPV